MMMDICDDKHFWYEDVVHDGRLFRIFNSTDDVTYPKNVDVDVDVVSQFTGTTFEMKNDNVPGKLVCLSTPRTKKVSKDKLQNLEPIALWYMYDGTHLNIFKNGSKLYYKTVNSFESEEVHEAREFVESQKDLKHICYGVLGSEMFSINAVWCNPNRSIVPYSEPKLEIINTRSLQTFTLMTTNQEPRSFWMLDNIEECANLVGVKGMIFQNHSEFYGLETDWYKEQLSKKLGTC